MIKKTRLIILFVCVSCFLVSTPVLVAYSIGYRFDFEKMKITLTGGIYVRTFPAPEQVVIDSKIIEKPGIFSNATFTQSLLPTQHTVLAQKTGYYDYFKTIPVEEKEVTKLENILLIKKDISFQDVSDKVDYFSAAPNNQNIITGTENAKNTTFNYFPLSSGNQPQTFLIAQAGQISDIKWSEDSSMAIIELTTKTSIFYYLFDKSLLSQTSPSNLVAAQPNPTVRLSYLDKNTTQISFNPQDAKEIFFVKTKTIYSAKNNKTSAIINNALAYKISGTNILWLSTDGFLYSSDFSGKLIGQLATKNIVISPSESYQIFIFSGKTYLQADGSLFSLNQSEKTLEDMMTPGPDYEISVSQDQKNLLYCGDKSIYLYPFADKTYEKIFSGDQISSCRWLNNYYIIFTSGDKIIISEIDYRGSINTVTLPQTAIASPENKVDIVKPVIFFNPKDNKLYILTNNTLLASEKLIP